MVLRFRGYSLLVKRRVSETQTCNPSTLEVEAGIQSQPCLYSIFKAILGYMKTEKEKQEGLWTGSY